MKRLSEALPWDLLREIQRPGEAGPSGKWSRPEKGAVPGSMAPRLDAAPVGVPASPEPSVERGEYLAENVMLCTSCHTAYDPATFAPVGPKGAGAGPEPSHGADADMEYVSPNLTASSVGVTGRLDEDEFVARLRAGRVYTSSIMARMSSRSATTGWISQPVIL